MKLFWKHFLSMMAMVLLSFALLGSVLIYVSFQKNLAQEQETGRQLLKMYQYSFLNAMDRQIAERTWGEGSAAKIAGIIHQNVGNDAQIRLYGADQKILYASRALSADIAWEESGEENGRQQVILVGDVHYLQNTARVMSPMGIFYLEVDINIEGIYGSSAELYGIYRRIMVVVGLISLCLTALLSRRLARPIQSLANATCRLSAGNYEIRVPETGNDEVTDLIRSFNAMAQELQENIGKLQQAARSQEEFTAAFAHELKTPLTSILGYGEALCTMELTEQEQRESAEHIYRQGKRLENLAYKMMQLTGIEKRDWEFRVVDAETLVGSVAWMTGKLCEARQVALDTAAEPGSIRGDAELLQSLLANLIDNAAKASEAGQTVCLRGRREVHGYGFVISDEGCGIPAEEIGRIHEAFYMVDKSRSRSQGSAGIGMTLAEKILKLHEGTWEIDSAAGQGTTIRLYFPEVRV